MLNAEVSLPNSVLQPVKTHVNTFRQLWSESTMSQTDSELVIPQDGRWGLGVAQVAENAAFFEGNFGGGKETPVFCLLYRQRNKRRECGRNCRRLGR
jgi:hypothetical protein